GRVAAPHLDVGVRAVLRAFRSLGGARVARRGDDVTLPDRGADRHVLGYRRQVRVAGYEAPRVADPDLPPAQAVKHFGRRIQTAEGLLDQGVVLRLGVLDVSLVGADDDAIGHRDDRSAVAD